MGGKEDGSLHQGWGRLGSWISPRQLLMEPCSGLAGLRACSFPQAEAAAAQHTAMLPATAPCLRGCPLPGGAPGVPHVGLAMAWLSLGVFLPVAIKQARLSFGPQQTPCPACCGVGNWGGCWGRGQRDAGDAMGSQHPTQPWVEEAVFEPVRKGADL